jgi:hypothetical protein
MALVTPPPGKASSLIKVASANSMADFHQWGFCGLLYQLDGDQTARDGESAGAPLAWFSRRTMPAGQLPTLTSKARGDEGMPPAVRPRTATEEPNSP